MEIVELKFLKVALTIFFEEALLKDASESGPLARWLCQHVQRATRLTFVTLGASKALIELFYVCAQNQTKVEQQWNFSSKIPRPMQVKNNLIVPSIDGTSRNKKSKRQQLGLTKLFQV